jgi:PKD repeat protein
MRKIGIGLFFILPLYFTGCYKESVLLVKSGFTVTVEDNNHTAPVKIVLENQSTGADFYKWTFEGGTPSVSDQKDPGTVVYNQAGTYTIKLEAWNDTNKDEKTFTFAVDSTVHIGFEAEILINDFAPAYVKITNMTEGASSYLWTFEGGTPGVSTEQQPGEVLFSEAGEHRITLEVSNGGETFIVSRTITLKSSLSVDFDIEPFFDASDYEVPFTAGLINKTQNGLTYEWLCTGATIDETTAENTTLHIASAGTYTVTLTANNGQETKILSKEITVKGNTNLYTVKDVKFGIKAAFNTVGYSYSLSQRAIVKTNEIDETSGSNIALLFSGLNANFNQCFFVSPDYAVETGFYEIPNAQKTYFVNKIEEGAIDFSNPDFDAMVNDNLLQTLDIKQAGNTTGTPWFDNTQIPRFVLFEMANGIKGVIKIKAFVSEGNLSYILTDIKHQKTAR